VINAELIETVEATPDTVLRLVNGRVYIVKESLDQVLSRVVAYKRALFEGLLGHPLGILPSHWQADNDAALPPTPPVDTDQPS
jgi:flagellar protein FlbD